MSYHDFIEKENKRINFEPVVQLIKNLKGKKVLIYAHDDPDGLTSAIIFTRLMKKSGIAYKLEIPPTMELEAERLKKDLSSGRDFAAVFVLDKATMGYYDSYYDDVKNFVVIDHHPLIGSEPKRILVMNPQLHGDYKGCSTSFLINMLATRLGTAVDYDDFLALVGLKGDWAIEPATDIVSDYVSEFWKEKVLGKFDNLIEKISSRPTMFEVVQKEHTTLLNQITELYFALGGGGFGYFYNESDDKLRDIDQRKFTYRVLDQQGENFTEKFTLWKNLDDFISDTFEPETVKLIFMYYLKDWEKAIRSFSSATHLCNLGETDLYVFIGHKVPLMPMAGSVYLNDLKKKSGDKEVVFIMINKEVEGGIHFSVRGTGDSVHSGKICSNLADRLTEKYNNKGQITGGGHFRAAECRTRNSGVSLAQALEVFAKLIMDMEKARDTGDNAEGLELGLEFLKERKKC